MNVTAAIDTRPFEYAIANYAEAVKKDGRNVTERQLRNWCWFAYRLVPVANRAAIARITGGERYRLIAWLLRRKVETGGALQAAPKGYAARGVAFDVKQGRRKIRKTGRVVSVFRVYERHGRFYTRAQAAEFAKKFFNRRRNAVSYVQSLMGAIVKSLRGSAKTMSGIRAASSSTETAAGWAVNAASEYVYRNTTTSAMKPIRTEAIDAMILRSLRDSQPRVVRDIEEYTARKIRESWDGLQQIIGRVGTGGISAADAARILAS